MPKLYFDKDEQGGWVPFKTAAIPGRSGIFIELAQAMQDYSGIQFIPVNLPAKRAEKALKDGLIDFDFVSLEWLKNNRVSDQYLTTNSFFAITEHLITLKKNTHLFPTRESMFCKRVGTIAGYFYFDDNEFIRTDFLNENHLMQGLKYERFKVIILERETAKYWAKINDTKIGFAALHTTGHILLRVRKKHSRLIPLLNKAIEAIKSSGQLESILNKHGVDSRIDHPHSQLNDNTQDVDLQK
ncbi:MAG: transporter substrate-binding domain-containing protein [Paraglaciecola sp.]|nr:transporter substrate-binding domain-containing protein [Paraglaciecola sp.]